MYFANKRHVKGQITRMKNESMQKVVQKYCKEAKIYRHCHVHLFRKTLATRLSKRGMPIKKKKKILGHNSIRTTEQFYLSICDQDIKYMYQKCI